MLRRKVPPRAFIEPRKFVTKFRLELDSCHVCPSYVFEVSSNYCAVSRASSILKRSVPLGFTDVIPGACYMPRPCHRHSFDYFKKFVWRVRKAKLNVDVHESVHRDATMKITNKMYYLYKFIIPSRLYMFRTMFSPIIRSIWLFTVSGSVHPSCSRLVSWVSWNCAAILSLTQHIKSYR
jgi:hypothetical protein